MVFKRRDSRHWLMVVVHWFYPRGGWGRAIQYIKHRLHRLPGTPESIARGVFAGVFTVFTPFFGVHFVTAAIVAKLVRGNIIAALLATFIGNPLTYLPIAMASIHTGYFLLGREARGVGRHIFEAFSGAWRDLKHNFFAMFSPERADWTELGEFYYEVFLPFMVGSLVPGVLCGLACYYLSVPVIRAYQQRRLAKLRAKMNKMRKQADPGADEVAARDKGE